jgi:hypothetical protein
MANNLLAFKRLFSSVPDFTSKEGILASGEEIQKYYIANEATAQSEMFISQPVLERLGKFAKNQRDYETGYALYKEIAFKLDSLHDLKYS